MARYTYKCVSGIITEDEDVEFKYQGRIWRVKDLDSNLKIISMLPSRSRPDTVNVWIRQYNNEDDSGKHIYQAISGIVKAKKPPS